MKEKTLQKARELVTDYSRVTALAYGRLKSLYRKGKTITEYESLEQKQSAEASAKSTENRLKTLKEREYAEFLSCMDLNTGNTKDTNRNISDFGDLVQNCIVESLSFLTSAEAKELVIFVLEQAEAKELVKSKKRKSMIDRLIIAIKKVEAEQRAEALAEALAYELVTKYTQDYVESKNAKKSLKNIYSVDDAFIYNEAEAKELVSSYNAEAEQKAKAEAKKLEKKLEKAEALASRSRKLYISVESKARKLAEKLEQAEAEAIIYDNTEAYKKRAFSLISYQKQESKLLKAKELAKKIEFNTDIQVYYLSKAKELAKAEAEAEKNKLMLFDDIAKLRKLTKACKLTERELALLQALVSNYNHKEFKKQVVKYLGIDKSNANKMIKNIAKKLKDNNSALYVKAEQNRAKAEALEKNQLAIADEIKKDIFSVKFNRVTRKAEQRVKALERELEKAEALEQAEAKELEKELAEARTKALERAKAFESKQAEAEKLERELERVKAFKGKKALERELERARAEALASKKALAEAREKAFEQAEAEAEKRIKSYKQAKELAKEKARKLERVKAFAEKLEQAEAEAREKALERVKALAINRAEQKAKARKKACILTLKAKELAEQRVKALERELTEAKELEQAKAEALEQKAKELAKKLERARAEALERTEAEKLEQIEAFKERELTSLFFEKLTKQCKQAKKTVDIKYLIWHNFLVSSRKAREKALAEQRAEACAKAITFIDDEQAKAKALAKSLVRIKASKIPTNKLLLVERV